MATEKELPSHLKSLDENTSSDLTETEKKKLSNLVFEFQDVFMSPDWQLKQTHLAEHYIDTGDTKPFKMPCRRIEEFPIIGFYLYHVTSAGLSSNWTSSGIKQHILTADLTLLNFYISVKILLKEIKKRQLLIEESDKTACHDGHLRL